MLQAVWLLWLLAQPPYQGFRAQSLEFLRQDSLTVLHLTGQVEITLNEGITAYAQEAFYTEKTGLARLLGGVRVAFPWGTITARRLVYRRPLNLSLFEDSVVVTDTGGRRVQARRLAYRPDTAWFQAPRLYDPRRALRLEADTGWATQQRGKFWRHAVLWWHDSSEVRADTLWLLQDTVLAQGRAAVRSGRFQGLADRVKITETWLRLEDTARVSWARSRLEAATVQIWQEDSSRYRIQGVDAARLEAVGERGTLRLTADTLWLFVVQDTLQNLRARSVHSGEYLETPKESEDGANPENP